jgi:hypothetical protein
MVKAILLKVYLIGAYFIGPSLARYWTSIHELESGNWILAKGHFNRGVMYILNLGKGLPKDSVKGVVIWNFGIAYSPRWPWQRKDHSTMFIYPLSFQRINGNKNIGRVLGKYVSTKTKAAGNASIIKFNGQSKVDKLYEYCKKIQQQQSNRTNVIIKRKVYNLLYDKIIYKLAYEMLINKSYNMVIITVKDTQYLNLNIFGCLILHPNLLGFNFETIISEIIIQIKTEHYKFTDLRKNLARKGEISTTFFVATLTKDIIVIKVIVIILETIYEPSFSSRKYGSSFNHKSALKDVKMRLKGAT